MPETSRNAAKSAKVPKKELPEQAAIVSMAAESGLLGVAGIREWACTVIGVLSRPPFWLIELATAQKASITDCLHILHEQSTRLDLRTRLQTIIACHSCGVRLLPDTLRELFFATVLDRHEPLTAPDESLVDALIAWDCQEDLDSIPPELEHRFETIFQTYLVDATEVRAILYSALPKTFLHN